MVIDASDLSRWHSELTWLLDFSYDAGRRLLCACDPSDPLHLAREAADATRFSLDELLSAAGCSRIECDCKLFFRLQRVVKAALP